MLVIIIHGFLINYVHHLNSINFLFFIFTIQMQRKKDVRAYIYQETKQQQQQKRKKEKKMFLNFRNSPFASYLFNFLT